MRCGTTEAQAQGDYSMRILLVEDHPALRQMIRDHLSQKGFVTDTVALGDEALSALRTAAYDAVILDLGLPDIDGMAVLAQLRSGPCGAIPILIVTARDAVQDRIAGLDAGADEYIVKPFDLAELEARLRAVLRRPGRMERDIYRFADLVFDTVSRTAKVGGTPLNLTRRETALLETLLRAAGNVVVRDALEDRLYGFDEPVTPNAIEAAVSRLRRKIKAANARIRIETRRGIGYRVVEESPQ